MSKLVFVFLLFSSSCFADEWTAQDSNREYAYLALCAVDWLQTRNIARNPHSYRERNRILGDHPTVPQVDRYFSSLAVAHVAIAKVLPSKMRKPFQYLSISFEVGWVRKNYLIGVSAKF